MSKQLLPTVISYSRTSKRLLSSLLPSSSSIPFTAATQIKKNNNVLYHCFHTTRSRQIAATTCLIRARNYKYLNKFSTLTPNNFYIGESLSCFGYRNILNRKASSYSTRKPVIKSQEEMEEEHKTMLKRAMNFLSDNSITSLKPLSLTSSSSISSTLSSPYRIQPEKEFCLAATENKFWVKDHVEVCQNALELIKYFHKHTPQVKGFDSGAHLSDAILCKLIPHPHMSLPFCVDLHGSDLSSMVIQMYVLTTQGYNLMTKEIYVKMRRRKRKGERKTWEVAHLAESTLRNLMSLKVIPCELVAQNQNNDHHIQPPKQKELYKRHMIQSQQSLLSTFNFTLDTLAKCRGGLDASQRAEDLLMRMRSSFLQKKLLQKQHQQQIASSSNSLYYDTHILSCCSPDRVSYNSVINAWSQTPNLSNDEDNNKSNDQPTRSEESPQCSVEAAKRAYSLMNLMVDLHLKEEDAIHNIMPDRFTMSGVINAWSRTKSFEAPMHAEDILQRMIELSTDNQVEFDTFPNNVTFSCVMDAVSYLLQQKMYWIFL